MGEIFNLYQSQQGSEAGSRATEGAHALTRMFPELLAPELWQWK